MWIEIGLILSERKRFDIKISFEMVVKASYCHFLVHPHILDSMEYFTFLLAQLFSWLFNCYCKHM